MGFKEKILGIGSGTSGGLSILGGSNVCHAACMSIATLLSAVGITISGMPLLFLQKVAIPFWIAAVVMLVAMIVLWKHKGMPFSPKTMLANSGFIIAGTPFKALNQFQTYFWIIGGIIVAMSICWAVMDRKKQRSRHA